MKCPSDVISSAEVISLRLFLTIIPALFAVTVAAEPPRVGDKSPEFSLPTLQGRTAKLTDELSKGPVALIVLRGYPGYQCPVCNRQMRDLLKNSQALASTGARFLIVYPGPAGGLDQHAAEFAKDKAIPEHFDLLLDQGYEFTNTYGLRWNAPNETAYPSTFLIAQDGTIFFSKVSKSHGGRTTAREIVDALQSKSAR